jgi:hypothetical protein
MKKLVITKMQKRLFVLLAIIIVYFIYDLATSAPKPAKKTDKSKNKNTSVKTAGVSADNQVISDSVAVQPVIQLVAVVPSDWKRDPFRGFIDISSKVDLVGVLKKFAEPRLNDFHLSAISQNGNNSYAIINDQILGVGGSINGFVIIEVQSSSVLLKKNEFIFTLKLEEDEYGL